MLFKRQQHGKTLYRSKPLLVGAKHGYIRPTEGSKEYFATTTTVWRVDELIRRRVRDWKRLLGEDGHTGTRSETFRADHDSVYTATYSVFPAPLVEWIILRYGGPPGSVILDAFSGGPVRSVVSTIMGHQYVGYDIRRDQIAENNETLKRLELGGATFIEGDGRYLENGKPPYDFALTCPPYHNLEQYSDLPTDLSNQGSYEQFMAGVGFSAHAHFDVLKPEAFCCWVVGPFRNKKTGELIDFPAHTVEAFQEAGFIFWQSIILSKNFGSAAKRSTTSWKGKKLVPIHEFLQVFRKPKE